MKYKNLLTAYVNENDKGKYITITNVDNEPFTLVPGAKVYLNATPEDVRKRYPKIPHFTKSVKVEEPGEQEFTSEDVSDSIPF